MVKLMPGESSKIEVPMKKLLPVVITLLVVAFAADRMYIRGGKVAENVSVPAEWKSFTNAAGVSFRYPETLGTKYIDVQKWPPEVEIKIAQIFCAEPLREINGNKYCVGSESEGAAGSIYTTYTYNAMKNNRLVTLRFILRYVQCGNYGEPQKSECERERADFNLDNLVDRVAQTVAFSSAGSGNGASGIKGTVLLGPICPVERIPPDPKCAPKPYAAKLVLTTADQSRAIIEFDSDADGKFGVQISPGEYAIRSAAASNIRPYCSSRETVKVSAGQFIETTVYCDTGIR